MNKLNIEYINPKSLKFYENNSKIHSDQQIDKVINSINNYGFKYPILIDYDNEIISGHCRILSAIKIGLKEIPCIKVNDLSQKDKIALRIADNKLTELGEWDYEKLNMEFDKLTDLETNFDLSSLGFDDIELEGFDNYVKEKSNIDDNNNKLFVYENDFILEDEILEEINRVEKVFISFSGGKGSTVVTYLMKPYIKNKGELIYVSTGYEFPDLIDFVIDFANKIDLPLNIVKPKQDFFQYYDRKKAFPEFFYRDCIDVFINKPIMDFIYNEKKCKSFINVRGSNRKQQTAKQNKEGRNSKFFNTIKYKKDNVIVLNPIFNLSKDSFLKYEQEVQEKIGLWNGYKIGFKRTACWCCPFQVKNQYLSIKKYYPILWEVLKKKVLEWDCFGKGKNQDSYFYNMIMEDINGKI